MFGSQILEVAIGLALVYLILSLICSAVNEWFASRLGMRAKCLEKAIKNLFNDPEKTKKAKEFYEHPLIKGLMDKEKPPSYIPSGTFALALFDIIAPSRTPGGVTSFENVHDFISKLPENEMKGVLLNFCKVAQNDIAKLRKDIEDWFNSAMERASGWYKRKTQWVILGISFVVSGFLNADSFMIANTLWRDDALRATVVASATQEIGKNASPSGQDTSAKIAALHAELQKLNLPIGWVGQENDPRAAPDDAREWIYKVLGILFTAIAISQGAPFWFDLLNKFVNLRGVGKKPEG